PAVQAAQHHARLATGATGVDDLRLVDVVRDDLPDGGTDWHVELADPGCSVLVRERYVDTGRPLTCAATAPGRTRVFDVRKLSTGRVRRCGGSTGLHLVERGRVEQAQLRGVRGDLQAVVDGEHGHPGRRDLGGQRVDLGDPAG